MDRAAVSRGPPARTATTDAAAPDSSRAALAAKVEALNRRIRGMEGKLKESAAVRKGADQARMEAERRLAEGTQRAERLEAQARALRDANAALAARLRGLEAQIASTAAALEAARQSLRRLAAQRDAERARPAAQPAAGPRAQGGADDRPGGGRPRPLPGTAQTQVDPVAGPREPRARAADAAAALRAANVGTGIGGPGIPPGGPRALERDLQRSQTDVARAAGARTVHRVAAGDTLALLARRFYADSARWPVIYEANRHVLADPDRLFPGLSLVIP